MAIGTLSQQASIAKRLGVLELWRYTLGPWSDDAIADVLFGSLPTRYETARNIVKLRVLVAFDAELWRRRREQPILFERFTRVYLGRTSASTIFVQPSTGKWIGGLMATMEYPYLANDEFPGDSGLFGR